MVLWLISRAGWEQGFKNTLFVHHLKAAHTHEILSSKDLPSNRGQTIQVVNVTQEDLAEANNIQSSYNLKAVDAVSVLTSSFNTHVGIHVYDRTVHLLNWAGFSLHSTGDSLRRPKLEALGHLWQICASSALPHTLPVLDVFFFFFYKVEKTPRVWIKTPLNSKWVQMETDMYLIE